jgi:release factor glutamine methyltransferase
VSDKRALIPRPETEQLVEYLGDLTFPQSPRILDVGTGSGVIILSLAARLPSAQLHAVDISDEALSLARENAERLGVGDRIQFSHSHLLDQIQGEFDLIVANLPYVAVSDAAQLSPDLRHEPAIALYGGEGGDELIRDLIAVAPPYLRPRGWLALEIGHGQSEALSRFLEEKNYHDIAAKKDYAGTPRFLFARYG